MNALMWDLIGPAWEIVATGLMLLVVVAIVAGPGDDDEDEDDGSDEGASWDRARDQWLDEQNGVA